MKRCVIVGGADIHNYGFLRERLNSDDYAVFCDSGLKHLKKLSVKPSLIVGDFDSHKNPHLDIETIVLPCEKDDTDTVFAVKEALRRGFDDFLLIGVIGARLDHTLGNVSILLYLDSLGKKGCIIDDYSEMEIVSHKPVSIPDSYAFFSLLNISGCAKGITVTGAKYPLSDGEIACEYQYGVSNEVLPGETASVSVSEGRLLLIKDRYCMPPQSADT
ncbi:MAG: thiamine diphosphokinase [Oscillospiraceae bacterium]|nr:thiamine diphosphokinase [Oscillospiraceae bacterium]